MIPKVAMFYGSERRILNVETENTTLVISNGTTLVVINPSYQKKKRQWYM